MERWVYGFEGVYHMFPLIHLGFCGSPHLGLAHDGLVISLVDWGLSWLCVEDNGGDIQSRKVSFAWDFVAIYFVLF